MHCSERRRYSITSSAHWISRDAMGFGSPNDADIDLKVHRPADSLDQTLIDANTKIYGRHRLVP
jgi:hypothetical protein